MIRGNVRSLKQNEPVTVVCDLCASEYKMLKIAAQRNIRRNGHIKCQSCSAKEHVKSKPQCSSGYWTVERRSDHSDAMLASESYRKLVVDGFFKRTGEANHRFGTRATILTKAKMSKSRQGKIGPNATAWKGGKRSLNKMVKAALQKRHNWFGRVISRDGKCMHCPTVGQRLDAHHIKPISVIIRELLSSIDPNTILDKFEYLMQHPQVVDIDLENGVALCRLCHMKVHNNWGSRSNP